MPPNKDAEVLARFAALIADRSRASICLALLDGRAWTAGELARHAGVSAPTMSAHLDRLVTGGVLAQERQGRHRYVRLAGPEIAQIVEDVSSVLGMVSQPTSLRQVRSARELAAARTCYDHLAGRLGVSIFDAMVFRGLLDTGAGLSLTEAGRTWFVDLGCELGVSGAGRRPVVRSCLDWTERRHHLAGTAGASLHHCLLSRGWTVRHGDGRAIRVTAEGDRALSDLLGLDVVISETVPRVAG